MKAERINKDQVRFTIDESDLQARNLQVSELAYGSRKTQALFDDMMKQAMEMFGLDFSNRSLMIEAIPLSDDKLSVTVTKVEGMAEVGAMIGANLPGAEPRNKDMFRGPEPFASGERSQDNSGEKLLEDLHSKILETMKEVTAQAGEIAAQEPAVYFFHSMEKLPEVAAQIHENFPLKNRLYLDMGDGCYYLICEFKHVGAKTRHLISMLSQFADEWYAGSHVMLMAQEHGIKVLGARALQKLGAVQRSE